MKLTQKQVIEEIKMGKSLKDFPEWCDDEEVVLEAVKNFSYSLPLQFASSRLRGDKEVVLVAVKNDGWALEYVSKKLKDDKEVVLEAVKNFGYSLQYASNRLKDDKEVVLKAVKNYSWNLEIASERLRDDKDVVLTAIKQNGLRLTYASERLKDDKEVVLEAICQDGWALRYASNQLKKELLQQALSYLKYKGSFNSIELVKHDGNYLCLLSTEECANKKIVLEAVKKNASSLRFASQEIQNKIGDNNPIQFLEQWIKKEKIEQQLNEKEKSSKIKI